MMKRSFKTCAKELQDASAAAEGHIVKYANTRYSEGTTIAGSSTGSLKTALLLPPQPLLVKFPLPPPLPTLSLNFDANPGCIYDQRHPSKDKDTGQHKMNS
jgi:hypothetical protein